MSNASDSRSREQVRTSPAPLTSSSSRQVSWKPPTRNELDSTAHPATAPPIVMPSSSGTTAGTSPRGNVASTRSAKVSPGSATQRRASRSMCSTLRSGDTSIAGLRKRRSPGSGTTWWTPPLSMWTRSPRAARSRTSAAMVWTRASCSAAIMSASVLGPARPGKPGGECGCGTL
ncbi:hypothetical protein OV079_41195 [Nannocystis pusilla]|uniref:Uncharacterized protein n=1 Tax=Nannocystis pusilla TaxID=889268 RepID=A0A9X3F5A9_9BACT|nr:hypothetical protein [Nannocystis pusilla]MCY1011868.1 hypothetical protein [Nannocystis pusilla]